MPGIPSMTVEELKKLRDGKKPHFLLDVREPDEYEICKIEGSTLIPMGEIENRLAEIPKDRELVVHCHHGGRSAHVVQHLMQMGFTQAKNLTGGIDAWSARIDPSVPRY